MTSLGSTPLQAHQPLSSVGVAFAFYDLFTHCTRKHTYIITYIQLYVFASFTLLAGVQLSFSFSSGSLFYCNSCLCAACRSAISFSTVCLNGFAFLFLQYFLRFWQNSFPCVYIPHLFPPTTTATAIVTVTIRITAVVLQSNNTSSTQHGRFYICK